MSSSSHDDPIRKRTKQEQDSIDDMNRVTALMQLPDDGSIEAGQELLLLDVHRAAVISAMQWMDQMYRIEAESFDRPQYTCALDVLGWLRRVKVITESRGKTGIPLIDQRLLEQRIAEPRKVYVAVLFHVKNNVEQPWLMIYTMVKTHTDAWFDWVLRCGDQWPLFEYISKDFEGVRTRHSQIVNARIPDPHAQGVFYFPYVDVKASR